MKKTPLFPMKPLFIILLLSSLLPAQEVEPAPPQVEPINPLEVKPSRDIFDLATLYYNSATETKDAQKRTQDYRLAANKFDRFLRAFPNDKKAIDAWYFLALSYRQINELEASRTCFETIANRWDTGKFVAGSALHLARDDYQEKKWKSAAKWFLTLARTSEQPKVRHESLYRRFLCFNELNDPKEIHASLDAILADPENPYRETAKIALARFHQNAKAYQKAFPLFVQLSTSKKQETAADSTLQAALCAQAIKDQKQTLIWFAKALDHPGLKDWRGQTQFTLMNLNYQAKNHKEVTRIFEKGNFKLEAQPHLQRLIIASKSYEALGNKKEALHHYQEIYRLAPKSDAGFQAAYRLLVQDHTNKKKNFTKQAENFLTRHQKERTRDRRFHSARLLLAEDYYEKKDYRRALRHYQALDLSLIDSSNQLGVRYRETKCHLGLKQDQQALTAINAFQKDYPKSKQLTQLRLQRGEILSRLDREDEALVDFHAVLAATSDSDTKLRALILQRLSGIYQEKKEHEKFAATQQKILMLPGISEKMKATAQFWLGVEDFRLKNYPEAEKQLRIAREMFPKEFAIQAGSLLIRCAYQSGNLDTLEKEIHTLRKADPNFKAPQPIIQWLGANLAKQGHYKRAWPFLNQSLKKPKKATALIWKLYAESSLTTNHPAEALRAADERLKLVTHPYRKAETLFQKSQAHNALGQFNDARQAADDALALHPTGNLNLSLRLFAGDIEMSAKQPQEALRHFVIVESLYAKTKAQKIEATEKLIASLKAINSPKALKQISEYEKSLSTLKAAE